MACGALTYGFDYECDDANGGIKQGSILIGQWEDFDGNYTITSAGEVSALSGGTFYRYQVKKEIAGAVTTETHDPIQGTTVYETVADFMLNKLSASKNVQLELLVSKPLVIIYQDNEDTYHIMGLKTGAEKMGGTNGSQTGKALNDQNGYQLAFTSREDIYPPIVQSAVVSGLTIGSMS